jgi:hypothetical protein
MTTSQPILDRLKKLQTFTVEVTVNESITIPGFTPYNMRTDPNFGVVRVEATSKAEAESIIRKYLT